VPPFAGPTDKQLAGLEGPVKRILRSLAPGKRPPASFAYRQPLPLFSLDPRPSKPLTSEWWFLVRHGMTCRRGACHGEWPAGDCLLTGRNGMTFWSMTRRVENCALTLAAKRERDVFFFARLESIFFGRPDFFPGTAKYTLAPLVRRGPRLPGLRRRARYRGGVHLKEVEFFHQPMPHGNASRAKPTISLNWSNGAEVQWPARVEQITAGATFEVKFLPCPAGLGD